MEIMNQKYHGNSNKLLYNRTCSYTHTHSITHSITQTHTHTNIYRPDVYERAIANVPPVLEKRFWRRYVYLWIYYALFEETMVLYTAMFLIFYRLGYLCVCLGIFVWLRMNAFMCFYAWVCMYVRTCVWTCIHVFDFVCIPF